MNLLRRIVARSACTAVCLAAAAVAGADGTGVQLLQTATLVRAFADRPPDGAQGSTVALPHHWSDDERRQGGEAWYLMHWSLPASATGQALYLTAVTMPAEVWVNGGLVGRTGAFDGRPPRSFEQSRLFTVDDPTLRDGVNVVAIRVRSQPGTFAALGPVAAGDHQQLSHRALQDLLVHTLAPAAIGVATITGGLFILGLWARRRDPSYALFGAAALLWGVHTIVSQLPERPVPQPHWFVLWHGTYMLFVGLLCLFMIRFAEVRWTPYRRAAVAFVAAVVPVLYAAHAAGAAAEVSTAIRAFAIGFVLVALYAVVRRALAARDRASAMLLATGVLSAAFAIHDWMAANSEEIRPVWLVPYAALAFLLLVGSSMIDRFVRALKDSERMNVELEARVSEKSAALASQLAVTQEARDAAEAASVAKSRFLAAASHDLRQPLHAIGLFTAALAEQTANPGQEVLVQRIGRSVEALEALLSSLLDISKLDAGVVTASPRDIAADPMLDRLAQEFAPEALRKGLKLAVVPTRAIVRTDPLLLERILRNLIANALHYTSRGGVVVGCRPRGACIAFEVRDSGPGIAVEDRDRIFEEFYQTGTRETDRAGGLGLGLAIVRRLADLLGHEVTLDSWPGRGSVFRVVVARGDAANVRSEAAPAAKEAAPLAGRRVLVVEDEAPVRAGTERLLLAWGCIPLVAPDASTAAHLAASGAPPDAAIVDFRLRGGSDGLQALDVVERRLGRRIPAVIVSGESHSDELERIQGSGYLLLHKPVAPARLRAALAWLLTGEQGAS